MARGLRAKDQRTVTFTVHKSLVEDIDVLAAAEHRSRSNWLVKELETLVAQKRGKISADPPTLEDADRYRPRKESKAG